MAHQHHTISTVNTIHTTAMYTARRTSTANFTMNEPITRSVPRIPGHVIPQKLNHVSLKHRKSQCRSKMTQRRTILPQQSQTYRPQKGTKPDVFSSILQQHYDVQIPCERKTATTKQRNLQAISDSRRLSAAATSHPRHSTIQQTTQTTVTSTRSTCISSISRFY